MCQRCDSTGMVCENHADRPWDGDSGRDDACGCGAGAPCPDCIPPGEWPQVIYPIPAERYLCAIPGFLEHLAERRAVFLKNRH